MASKQSSITAYYATKKHVCDSKNVTKTCLTAKAANINELSKADVLKCDVRNEDKQIEKRKLDANGVKLKKRKLSSSDEPPKKRQSTLKFSNSPCKRELKSELKQLSEKAASVFKISQQATEISTEEPDYTRYHSLEKPPLPTLSLPAKFKFLSEAFRCTDVVVSILSNRKELITFEKLKNGVQDMLRRSYTKSHLAQILSVFPPAYCINLEKNNNFMTKMQGTSDYHLVITPNIMQSAEDNIQMLVDENQNMKVLHNKPNKKPKIDNKQMTAADLIKRRNIFNNLLFEIVKKRHKEFLSNLNPPITISDEKVTRWHSKFCLDSIPDVQPVSLPEPPNLICSKAIDVLNKLRGNVKGRVEQALHNVAENKHPTSNEKNIKESSSPKEEEKSKQELKTNSKTVLKGICSNLLEKVRARESAKILENMTRNPSQEKRIAMLQNIPEIVRILRNYFIAARKVAISLDDATEKIIDSFHSSLDPGDVKEHLQLICEVMPGWLFFVTIPKGVFLKIDKSKDLNIMLRNLPKS